MEIGPDGFETVLRFADCKEVQSKNSNK